MRYFLKDIQCIMTGACFLIHFEFLMRAWNHQLLSFTAGDEMALHTQHQFHIIHEQNLSLRIVTSINLSLCIYRDMLV